MNKEIEIDVLKNRNCVNYFLCVIKDGEASLKQLQHMYNKLSCYC